MSGFIIVFCLKVFVCSFVPIYTTLEYSTPCILYSAWHTHTNMTIIFLHDSAGTVQYSTVLGWCCKWYRELYCTVAPFLEIL